MTTTISLTFDDAHDAHLDLVVPCLNEHLVCGTFYVDFLSQGLTRRSAEWRQVAHQGHELGNHSLFHPGYPPASHVREGNSLEFYTLDRMSMELELANRLLAAIDGRTIRSFAYPNANPVLGEVGWTKRLLRALGWDRTRLDSWVDRWGLDFGATRRNYRPVVERQFFAARGGMLHDWPATYDRFFVPSFSCDRKSLAELLQFVDRMVAAGSWGVLMFHNVGPSADFSCDSGVFREFVARLAGDSRIAVKTFIDAACEMWPLEGLASGSSDADSSVCVDPQDSSDALELIAVNPLEVR
jgi:peptidoglycan/xylan/chitin deacetylase (PgdA/CDA1 family)